jgi:transposase
MKSEFRPILILGNSAAGKTELVRNVIKRFIEKGFPRENIIVISKENEYSDLGIQWSNRLRKRDILADEKIIVLEDLPRLATKRTHRILMELLTQTRHYRTYVIATSQTEGGFDLRFLSRFKVIVFFRNVFNYQSYQKWWRAFGGVANFLKEKVGNLEKYHYVIYDRENDTYFNGFENKDEKGISILEEGVNFEMKGEKLTDLIEREKTARKINVKNLSDNNKSRVVKEARIIELLEKGKNDYEIAKILGTSVGYVSVVKSRARGMGLLKELPKKKEGRPRQNGLTELAEAKETKVENYGVNSKGIILFSKSRKKVKSKVRV